MQNSACIAEISTKITEGYIFNAHSVGLVLTGFGWLTD